MEAVTSKHIQDGIIARLVNADMESETSDAHYKQTDKTSECMKHRK
jgi:hypothetical protein